MQKSVREWTLTLPSALPSELPFWELESQWTPEFSKGDCKGRNSMDLRVPYIIGKLLDLRCLKWAHMTHLDTWNTSYGQKKGRELNWQFDSWSLKVGNRPNFLACKWRATYHWKALNSATWLQFCFRPHFNQRSTHKFMGPQSRGSPNFENFKTPTWESWDKMPLGCHSKYTIRGKMVASTKSTPWWILWVRISPWLILALKVL
jgi:hypothetical protein